MIMTNKKMAQQDFDLLKIEFKKIKGDDNSDEMLYKLFQHFNGYNLEQGQLFDFNYKRLRATISKHNRVICLCDDVDFYKDDDVCVTDEFALQEIS